jgi:phosphoribosyl-AMP cyclohydrolase
MLLLKNLKFDSNNLIPAIIQDYQTSEVLMLGYMNPEALKTTIDKGKVCFYSRSRKKLWVKGETSGHIQTVKEIRYDCDGDTLLIIVEQKGGACHLGYKSCFFTKYESKKGSIIDKEKIFNPNDVYRKENNPGG